MPSAAGSTFVRLQNWYVSQCNDEWEHAYGVHIGTLDNPGWEVQVNLRDTPLENRSFSKHVDGEDDSNYDDAGNQIGPWLTCEVKDRIWQAYCGPHDLERTLIKFLDWAGA